MAKEESNDLNPWQLSERMKERVRRKITDPIKAAAHISSVERERERAWELARNPNLMIRELNPLLDSIHANKKNRLDLAKAIGRLQRYLARFGTLNQHVPKTVGNHIANSLHPLYKSSDSAGRASIVRLISRYASAGQPLALLFSALDSANEQVVEAALSGIAWNRSLRGNERLYERLAKMRRGDRKNSYRLLSLMSRIDRTKTLPDILSALKHETDVRRFIGLADLISEYRKPELIEPILFRISDFPYDPVLNATIGIDHDLLLHYIREHEDAKLEVALTALVQHSVALRASYEVLLDKLESGTPKSKIAAYSCMRKAVERGAFRDKNLLNDLESRIAAEQNPDVLPAASTAFARIKQITSGREK